LGAIYAQQQATVQRNRAEAATDQAKPSATAPRPLPCKPRPSVIVPRRRRCKRKPNATVPRAATVQKAQTERDRATSEEQRATEARDRAVATQSRLLAERLAPDPARRHLERHPALARGISKSR
jgi:hypothetical protein